jgi:hypothetical protein
MSPRHHIPNIGYHVPDEGGLKDCKWHNRGLWMGVGKSDQYPIWLSRGLHLLFVRTEVNKKSRLQDNVGPR